MTKKHLKMNQLAPHKISHLLPIFIETAYGNHERIHPLIIIRTVIKLADSLNATKTRYLEQHYKVHQINLSFEKT
jgi:hypothetical protein